MFQRQVVSHRDLEAADAYIGDIFHTDIAKLTFLSQTKYLVIRLSILSIRYLVGKATLTLNVNMVL